MVRLHVWTPVVWAMFLSLLLVQGSYADVYMHNLRGSNNRLDEAQNNRANANRLFDSQNNNQGGYNVGSLYYHVGSELDIEWTMQHSCGGPNTHCQMVLQYMCEDSSPGIRDGTVTARIPDDPIQSQEIRFGQHETYDYYQRCKTRSRNRGLWTAGRDIRRPEVATRTRQNQNGNRYGFECAEERDYYPYWHPTPWRDIAVMVDSEDMAFLCPIYQAESQNVKEKYECVDKPQHNNQRDCLQANGIWEATPSWDSDPPQCVPSCWNRDNHLGNTLGGSACSFRWTVPDHISERCIFRMRYNITTGDVGDHTKSSSDTAWWFLDSGSNTNAVIQRYPPTTLSPRPNTINADGTVVLRNIQGNTIDVDFGLGIAFRLAINTAQTGRVFQDRSHVFAIRPRPMQSGPATRIVNLNVRGKRGNIVQVYPAVEYDFHPNHLNLELGDMVHLQWTGSDTNPNGNDGEGKAGTDRSNWLQFPDRTANYPLAAANYSFFETSSSNVHRFALLNLPQLGGETSTLDDVGTYFDGGILTLNRPGTYVYGSTRNNNFSNRSQKGSITVSVPESANQLSNAQVAGIVVGSLAAAGIVAVVVVFLVRNPTRLRNIFRSRDEIPLTPSPSTNANVVSAPAPASPSVLSRYSS